MRPPSCPGCPSGWATSRSSFLASSTVASTPYRHDTPVARRTAATITHIDRLVPYLRYLDRRPSTAITRSWSQWVTLFFNLHPGQQYQATLKPVDWVRFYTSRVLNRSQPSPHPFAASVPCITTTLPALHVRLLPLVSLVHYPLSYDGTPLHR